MEPITISQPEQLGEIIRTKRKAAGLTQKKAASLAGVGTRFLSELERGKPTAQLGKTIRILQLLGLELRIRQRHQDP
jgi:y4mF family transcriptional regulator